jgi:hypothetical protein
MREAKAPNHPSDPRLQDAAERIKEILREFDIAGVVTLCSGNGHAEYVNYVTEPTWSCLSFHEGAVRVRAKVKSAPAEDRVLEKIKLQKTVNTVILMRDVLANQYLMFYGLSKKLHEVLDIQESAAINS